jgi:hypothetical protein
MRDHAFQEISSPMISAIESLRSEASTRLSIFFLAAVIVLGRTAVAQGKQASLGARDNSAAAVAAPAMPPVIVMGFVGGLIRHDDPVHDEVRLAARLRKAYPTGVDVETFENYNGETARKKILALLDTDHDGTLTDGEKQNARIILYGHSWGASEAIALARELEKDGIPVLLTVQVDSVSKISQNDAVIPANVAQAANFYQPDGFIHGQSKIRAADPSRTKIIGNYRFDYEGTPYTCNEYPWFDRVLVKTHTQIECDPKVWKQVEGLIRSDLPSTNGNDSGQ